MATLRCFRVTGTHNWIQGRVVWWYHICFARGGPWAQSPACPLDRQHLKKSCVRSSARAWRRLDYVNAVGHLNPRRVQLDRRRLVKSRVGSSAKAWLRLDNINVVGQLGGCDASLRPVLRMAFKGAWCSGITSASHAAQSPACPI